MLQEPLPSHERLQKPTMPTPTSCGQLSDKDTQPTQHLSNRTEATGAEGRGVRRGGGALWAWPTHYRPSCGGVADEGRVLEAEGGRCCGIT